MGSFNNFIKVFTLSDQRQGSNHIEVSRKELNGGVEQVALRWVAGWYSDTWAQAQLPMEASKFSVTWAWWPDFHCYQSYFGCHWTERTQVFCLGKKSQPKTPCMVLSSALIQLFWKNNWRPVGHFWVYSLTLVHECFSKSTEPLNSTEGQLTCQGLNRFPVFRNWFIPVSGFPGYEITWWEIRHS